MNDTTTQPPKLPPRWFKHAFWRGHRALYRIGGGRLLWTPAHKRKWGAMRITTTGRKTGRERTVIVGYLADGSNVVALAMNGWDEGHPAWWLNLEADPNVIIHLPHQDPRPARAHAAVGDERRRLWDRWLEIEPETDAYAASHAIETPVVVFEPYDAT